jgi:hypothetical protein
LRYRPDDQAHHDDRRDEPGENATRPIDRGTRLLGLDDLGLQQHVTGGVVAGLRDHHVARARGEHVGHVEAARAAQHRRHPLLEQQSLDELGLGLMARAGDAHQRPLGVLRLDLARARVALGHRLVGARPRRVDQRHPARRAEGLVEPVGGRAPRADERLSQRRPAPR